VADGPSAKAGLRTHDVLVQLDGKRLTTVEHCDSLIQEIKDRKVTATLFRGGKEMTLEITPQLSSTAVWAAPPMSTIMLNNAIQGWLGRVNLNTTGVDSIQVWQPEVRWHADLNRYMSTLDPAARAPAAEQIAQLKRQLEEMQKSISALEATLRTAAPQQPANTDQPSPQPPTDKLQP
jgi:hypothetical protein